MRIIENATGLAFTFHHAILISELDLYIPKEVDMLTNREVAKRINHWAKKPRSKAPVCYHNESHGRLKAQLWANKLPYFLKPDHEHPGKWKPDYRHGCFYENVQVLLVCPKCSFKLLPHDLPESAFRKAA